MVGAFFSYGFGPASSYADNVEQGETQMKFSDIKFTKTKMPKGIQAILKFGEYELSIIKSDFSYGGKNGYYEIAVFKGEGQIELPGITEGDTVKGWLSEDDVTGILLKMVTISGIDVPKQVASS